MSRITTSLHGPVQVIEIDNPPVNATSQAVRQGLFDAFAAAAQDPRVQAIVLACSGSTWVAGADIKEFGKPPAEPLLIDVIDRIERSEKPVVAALKGSALGGGLEIAMGCHLRVATRSTKLGLPESTLGIVPGAGGIARLMRLVGTEACVDMASGGKPVPAERAAALGLVDLLCDGDPLPEAIRSAGQAARSGTAPRRSRAIPIQRAAAGFFDAARRKLAASHRGQVASLRCVDLAEAAEGEDFDTSIVRSRDAFRELVVSEQARALRQAFTAERVATKPEGLPKVEAGFQRVGIVGAGTMGTGIAIAVLNAGLPVVLVEPVEAALSKARASIARTLNSDVAKGRVTQEAADRRLAALTPATGFEALAGCDLVIEAVFEDMAVKREVFAAIEAVVPDQTVIASNTSYLDIDRIAEGCRLPGRVVGMHFFSPANVMKLLENVRAARSEPMALAKIQAFGKTLGKVPVLIGVSDGFVGNRMLAKRMRESLFMLEEGALPQQVDQALVDFGFPIGQFQLNDLAGVDVAWRNRQSRLDRLTERERLCTVFDKVHALGRLGQKSGAGFYLYDDRRQRSVDPLIDRLVIAHSAERGFQRRELPAAEIVERALFAMVNEGAKILDEGIAARPEEIDTIWLNGYGFPRHRGGPMFHADSLGLKHVLERIRQFGREHGAEYWEPARLLVKLAEEGRGFYGATR